MFSILDECNFGVVWFDSHIDLFFFIPFHIITLHDIYQERRGPPFMNIREMVIDFVYLSPDTFFLYDLYFILKLNYHWHDYCLERLIYWFHFLLMHSL